MEVKRDLAPEDNLPGFVSGGIVGRDKLQVVGSGSPETIIPAGSLQKTPSVNLRVTIAPWFSELVDNLKGLVERCLAAGVPHEVLEEHVYRMIESAAKRAVRIG